MKTTVQFTERELATVLAALRHFQKINNNPPQAPAGYEEHFLEVKGPLGNDSINNLCERINCESPLRVLIEVSGGVVDPVHLSHDGEVIVYDHDNIEAGDEPPCDLEKTLETLPHGY